MDTKQAKFESDVMDNDRVVRRLVLKTVENWGIVVSRSFLHLPVNRHSLLKVSVFLTHTMGDLHL